MVIKPSEYTPKIGTWLAELSQPILGRNVIVCAQGGAQVGADFNRADINALVFTGSVASGKKVAAHAAQKSNSPVHLN